MFLLNSHFNFIKKKFWVINFYEFTKKSEFVTRSYIENGNKGVLIVKKIKN